MSENLPESMPEDVSSGGHEDVQWQIVEEVAGDPQAELLGSLLEAQNIPVILSQEGAGRAMGLTIGLLGIVQILVPNEHADQARQILDDYYGRVQNESDDEEAELPAES